MKKCYLIMLLMGTCLYGQAQATKEEDAVIELCKRKFQWMIQGKTDSLAAVLSEKLQFIHSNAWVQTKQDVIHDLQSKKLIYQSIDLRELIAKQFDKTVVVSGKGKFSGTVDGTAFATDLFFTEVYVLQKKTWLLVSRQATRIP